MTILELDVAEKLLYKFLQKPIDIFTNKVYNNINRYVWYTWYVWKGYNNMEELPRVKFTTTLAPDVIEKLQRMAPDYKTKNLNDVIEIVVREKWEAINNEMENKDRDNRWTST